MCVPVALHGITWPCNLRGKAQTTADTFRVFVDAPEPKGSSHAVVLLLRVSKEKFIPNLSSVLAQMHQLLQKNIRGGFG